MQSATTAAAPSLHLPVRQEWLDRRREEIIEPDLPIVEGACLLPEDHDATDHSSVAEKRDAEEAARAA